MTARFASGEVPEALVLCEALRPVAWRGQHVPEGGRLWLPADVAKHWQRRHAVTPVTGEDHHP